MSLFASYPAQANFTVSGLDPAPGLAESPRQRGGIFVGVGVIVGVALGVTDGVTDGVVLGVRLIGGVSDGVGTSVEVALLLVAWGGPDMMAQTNKGNMMIERRSTSLTADDFMN